MSVTRIATRYAKSLIELAVEQGKLPQVSADVQALASAAQNRDFHLMLKSPLIGADKKNAAIKAIFGKQMDSLTLAYLQLLVNKGREVYLSDIASEFLTQYKTMQKITTVKITTANPMSEDALNLLKSKILASGITHENLDIEIKVNPDLIGGFTLEFDSKRYDASIANKLAELKSEFTKNLYIKEY